MMKNDEKNANKFYFLQMFDAQKVPSSLDSFDWRALLIKVSMKAGRLEHLESVTNRKRESKWKLVLKISLKLLNQTAYSAGLNSTNFIDCRTRLIHLPD